MKRILLTMLAISVMVFSYAQQGEIIVTDFVPDLSISSQYTPRDTIKLDIDRDGTIDIKYYFYIEKELSTVFRPSIGWEVRPIGYEESDTIITDSTYIWASSPYAFIFGSPEGDGCLERYALRKTVGDQYCYGWIHLYRIDSCFQSVNNPNLTLYKYTLFVDKTAFCTVPDYPLKWGQTSLTGIEENDETTAFATVHPNPTTGLVIITGENLRQAEVFNVLGQKVLIATGKGNEITIDLSKLSTGVYLINVTDEEGKKCVRKVVRE